MGKRKEKTLQVKITTNFGKNFEDNIFSLLYFMDMGKYIPTFEPVINAFQSTINENKEHFDLDKTVGKVRDLQTNEYIPISLGESIEKYQSSIKEIKETESNFYKLNLSDRLFAYYIFSLTAYLDAYCSDLIDFFFDKSSKLIVRNLAPQLDRNMNSRAKFNKILNFLEKRSKGQFKSIINSDPYRELDSTTERLVKLRNEIAHKKPEVKLDHIYERFKHMKNFYWKPIKILQSDTIENNIKISNLNEIETLEKELNTLINVGTQLYMYVCYIDAMVVFSLN